MTSSLYYYGFEDCLVAINEMYSGIQYKFKFDNGYGASVIKHLGSHGHEYDSWELSVLTYDELGRSHYTCDTDISDDVIRWLTDNGVRKLLEQIQALAP